MKYVVCRTREDSGSICREYYTGAWSGWSLKFEDALVYDDKTFADFVVSFNNEGYGFVLMHHRAMEFAHNDRLGKNALKPEATGNLHISFTSFTI